MHKNNDSPSKEDQIGELLLAAKEAKEYIEHVMDLGECPACADKGDIEVYDGPGLSHYEPCSCMSAYSALNAAIALAEPEIIKTNH